MKNKLLTIAAGLLLLAVVGKFYAPPVLAQVRAALIKNIDEKGRIPYMQSGFRDCNATGSALCDLIFQAVPVGKRLVSENVSANLGPNPGVGVNATFLLGGGGGNSYFSLPGVSMATPQVVLVNQSVLSYYESGQAPAYRVAWSTSTTPGAFSVVIAGYLVDLTE